MIDHLISLPLSWTSVFSVLIADIYFLYILLYFLILIQFDPKNYIGFGTFLPMPVF
jgi:hypothetical protein